MKHQTTSEKIITKQTNPELSGQSTHNHLYFVLLSRVRTLSIHPVEFSVMNAKEILLNLPKFISQKLKINNFISSENIEQYHVINKLDFPLFEHQWSANEELLLFEGLQKHGFGNWNDIADFVGNNKSAEEVQEHYQQIYIKNCNFLPNNAILVKRNQDNMLVETDPENQPKRQIKTNKFNQITPATTNRVSLPAGKAPPKVNTNPAEIVGFMPRRGDFEIQYDNDAQLLLAQMQFNQDDTQEQKIMKFRLMDIYNHKLSQRNKRKDFIIARKLLDIREQLRLDKTRTKDEKEIYNIMKVFARFNNPQDHDKLVQGLIKEKQIRQRIAQLKELKAKGLKTLGEVEDELDNKKKKDDKSKRNQNDFNIQKGKTRRIRKDPLVQKSEKRVLYINKDEQQLCKKINMTFRQYMTMKQTILRESVRQGLISKNEITGLFQVKRQISQTVYDFVVEQENLMQAQIPPNVPQR